MGVRRGEVVNEEKFGFGRRLEGKRLCSMQGSGKMKEEEEDVSIPSRRHVTSC